MKFKLTTSLSTLALTAIASLSLSGNAQAVVFTGNSSGTWGTPDPGANTAPAVVGVGTNTFIWGGPGTFGTGSNQLIFAGNPFSTGTDTLFQVGGLTYFNGTILTNTDVDSVPLDVALAFASPAGFSEVFSFNFDIVTTTNTADPVASADFVYPINSFGDRIFTFDGTEYTLQLTSFSQDGGLTSVSEFRVLEGATTTAALYGRITAPPPPTPVPTPSPTVTVAPLPTSSPVPTPSPTSTLSPSPVPSPSPSLTPTPSPSPTSPAPSPSPESVPEPMALGGLSLFGLYLLSRHRS